MWVNSYSTKGGKFKHFLSANRLQRETNNKASAHEKAVSDSKYIAPANVREAQQVDCKIARLDKTLMISANGCPLFIKYRSGAA